MSQRVRLVLAAVGVAIAYLLLFPQPSRTELLLDAKWTSSPEQDLIATEATPFVPFLGPDSYGYLSETGEVAYRGRLLHGIAIDQDHFVSYSRVPDQLVIQKSDGSFAASIAGRAYPYIESGRLFTVSADGCVLSEWNYSGVLIWSVPLSGPIGTLAAGTSYVIAGLSIGGVVVLDTAGSDVGVITTDEMASGIAYGIDSDSVHQRFALLTGPDPGRVTVFEKRDDLFVPVFRTDVESPPIRPITMRFDESGDVLVYETASGLRLANTRTGDTYKIDIESLVRGVAEDSEIGLFAVLGIGRAPDPALGFRRRANLIWFTSEGSVVVATPFPAAHLEMLRVGGFVYLTRDNRVLKLRIVEG